MSTKQSLIGLRFGRGVVFAEAPSLKGRRSWLRCDCGVEYIAHNRHLTAGNIKSCGCLRREVLATLAFKETHGQTKLDRNGTPAYRSWQGMRQRATNPNRDTARYYIGQGITVCAGLSAFTGFFEVLGERPEGKEIDRTDNEGNYSCGKCAECLQKGWPLNVRWVTQSESAINRSSTRTFTVQGVTGCMKELANHFGISYRRVLKRLKAGWTPEATFTKPVRRLIKSCGR